MPDDAQEWKPGDLVRLNAGGPVMSVYGVGVEYRAAESDAEITPYRDPELVGDVTCLWFADDVLRAGVFAAAQLEAVAPERPARKRR